jgi:RNA polymerase sigma-70 factor (ECF subfamily)
VGEDERFERLYREHAGRVRAYALRRVAAEAADDVVADVFVVCWRRLDDVPGEALPWLLGVARRVIANRRRGERRAAALHLRLATGITAPVTMPVASDPPVASALAELGQRDRELLMLIAWDGLSVTEAAGVLSARPGTVAVRLHRARRRFARALSAHDAPLNTINEVSHE